MRHEFSEETLAGLLQAMRARSETSPDNPGLIACWPNVREDRMATACAALVGQGYEVKQVVVPSTTGGKPRTAWAI
jgi:hypothetical protein